MLFSLFEGGCINTDMFVCCFIICDVKWNAWVCCITSITLLLVYSLLGRVLALPT